MYIEVKQVSGLEKIRPCGIGDVKEIHRSSVLKGERFSYQIAIQVENKEKEFGTEFQIRLESPLKEHIQLYLVKNVVMDQPTYDVEDEDYITKEPGIMPDLLIPAWEEENRIKLINEAGAIWVEIRTHRDLEAGEYPIAITLSGEKDSETFSVTQIMNLEVLNAKIPEQQTIYTQWIHADCIADVHGVSIYSEEHWKLIDIYLAAAVDMGINMILTPIITPPIDTEPGTTRPCVQLVDIEKRGNEYLFDFGRLKRWIALCDKNHIKYLEMAHLFSQGGLKYTPNIRIRENGEESYQFGWQVEARSESYREFLKQFLPSLINFLDREGVRERCWFHISDEPSLEHLSSYQYAYDIIKPLIGNCRTLDAMSDYDFVQTGLVERPVASTDHIEPFLENCVENLWGYYCCAQCEKVSNKFMAMPSYRNRILGLQIYKYGLEGFLQWGFNFYYSCQSIKKINPYVTTSGDKWVPSGDAFCVYPGKDRVYPSLRALVFRDALQDIEVCRILEEKIGRENVIAMIDEEAGMSVTFSEYPRNSAYIPRLMEKIKQHIKKEIIT